MDNVSSQQEKPDLSEWSKQNPGKTINDYFKIYGTNIPGNSYSSGSILDSVDISNENNLNKPTSKHSIWAYVLVSLFILIAFLSNPKKDEHRDALKIKLTGIVEEILAEKSEDILEFGLGKLIVDRILDETIKGASSDNYIFFSLTKYNYASDSRIIGFGFLGRVYISKSINKEMVINKIKQFNRQFND